MQVVEVTGVGNVEFPDDMSHEEIIQVIEKDILPPKEKGSEFGNTARSTTAHMANAFLGQPLEDIGNAVGSEGISGYGKRVREQAEQVQKENPSSISSVKDIGEHPIDALEAAAGNVLPQLPVSLASSWAGAEAGAAIGSVVPGAGTAIGAVIGGALGLFFPSYMQEYTEMRGKQHEGGKEDIPKALLTAMPAAAMDALTDKLLLGGSRLLPSSLRSAVNAEVRETGAALMEGAAPIKGGALDTALKIVKQGGIGAGAEGATEYAQTGLEQVGGNQDVSTPEAAQEREVSAALGAIGGGGIKGISAAMPTAKPEEAVKPEDQPAQEEVSGPLNVSRELKNVGISRNEHRKLFESLTKIDYSTPEGIAEAEGIISKRENIQGRHGLPAEFNNDAWNAFISNAKAQAGIEETTDETPPPPPPPENEEEDEVPPSPESKGTVKNKTISATYEQVGTHEDGTALYNATYTHKDGRTWTKENVPLKEATTLKLPPELLKPKKAKAAPIVETTPVVDEQEEEEEDNTPPPPPPPPPVVEEEGISDGEDQSLMDAIFGTDQEAKDRQAKRDAQQKSEEDNTPPPSPPPEVEEETPTPAPEVGRTVVANDFQEQQSADEKEQALFDAFLNIRQKSSEKTPEQEAYTGRTQLDVDEEISALNFQKEESLDPDEQKELSDKIRALRTEKKTLPRLSVAPEGVNTNHTVESLQPHLTPEMKRLVESGKLTLHDTADTLPGGRHPERVQGLTTPQGEVHLVASKLTPETLPKVAMHEVGVHVGMRGMVGDKVWGDLTSQALTTKGEAFDRARQAVPENTPEHLKGEETLAYLVENAPNLPIVKRAISAVKNWVRTTFGARLSITESDIHHLAAKALRRESQTATRAPREGTAFSFTPQGQASQAATEARKQGHPKPAANAPLTIGENIQKTADIIETSISSYDARYINTLRNQLTKMVKGSQITWDQMRDFLMRVSQSQTMHSTSTAGEAALRGGMKKSSATHMWEGVDSADNMPRIRQLISDIATKYGETFEETSKHFGEFMVAARIDEIYRAADNIKATAQTISGPARHAYLRKARKILDLAKNLHMSKAEVATHLAAFNSMPEFREPMEMWHRVRKNVIDTLVASGRYSPEQASNYMDAVAYVPFNRIMDVQDPDEMYAQMATGNFRKSGSLMAGQAEPGIKGSKTREVDDIILNMEKWVVNSYVKAIRADKSRELVDVAEDVLPQGSVTELDKNGPTAVVCYRNGVKEYWKFEDPIMRFAFNGVSPVPRSALSMGVKLATFLRNCIVYNPLFTLSQLPQDTYTAMYTSGVKRPLMLPFEVLKEFVGTAFSTTKAHERLKRIGAVGQKDFADQFGVSIHDLAYGGHHAGKQSAFGKIKDMAEHFAMAGDNAVRQAIYNRTMKEMKGRPEAEAIAQERAFEVINFRRRGASAGLDSIRQITPFLGAYIQANRAAYNAISGRGIAPSERKAALATMAGTTIQMMAMLWLYNALADHGDDDDEFKNKDSREKDTHIFPLRALGVKSNITLPIRADVFALPFVTGNHAYTYLMNEGTENPELAKEAMKAAVVAAFMNAPVGPTIIKPILEVSINHDFFTGRSVVPQRLVGADKEYQYKSDTSEFSKLLGKTGFISPISADHLIKGFAGYTGAAALATIDYGLRQGMDIPYADKSGADAFRSIPGMPSLLGKAHSDESQDVFYKLREEQEKAFRSYNMLKGEKRFEEARAYKEENRDMLNKGAHTALNHIITKVDALNRKKRIIMAIPNDSMSPADKRTQLDSIEERILNLERKSKALYNRVHP
jgi:hypothetical protein